MKKAENQGIHDPTRSQYDQLCDEAKRLNAQLHGGLGPHDQERFNVRERLREVKAEIALHHAREAIDGYDARQMITATDA